MAWTRDYPSSLDCGGTRNSRERRRTALRSRAGCPKPVALRGSVRPHPLPVHLHLSELFAHTVGGGDVAVVPSPIGHARGRSERDQQFAGHELGLLLLLLVELPL